MLMAAAAVASVADAAVVAVLDARVAVAVLDARAAAAVLDATPRSSELRDMMGKNENTCFVNCAHVAYVPHPVLCEWRRGILPLKTGTTNTLRTHIW